ncbi:MAG TPA: heavy-metal-associated domain-containing protein [Candidatus Nitrosocosmicus sp.]|nr:heavy-metal-associated domain-containing protein [Candidatus Nitrosocosmicus sp.]
MITKKKLTITGMHCSSCAMNIDGELEDLGVKNSTTNYAKAETEVEFDTEKITIEQVQKKIKEIGYQAFIK